MQKLLFTLFLSFISFSSLLAQDFHSDTLFGSYIDLEGNIIHGRADQDYTSSISLAASFNYLQDYAPGIYYLPGGEAIRGQMMHSPGKQHFLFKDHIGAKREKIFPSIGWTIKIGADSFIVANGFSSYGKLGIVQTAVSDPSILQFLGKTSRFAFYLYNPAIGSPHYVVQQLSNQEFIGLPLRRKAFLEKAEVLFSAYPRLLELLQEKEMDYEQIHDLIQFIRYSDALNSGKGIGYTSSWAISEEPDRQQYIAKVSRPDENWNWVLSFYNRAGQLLFTEHYAYTQPTLKQGEGCWYYPGTDIIRKKTYYESRAATTSRILNVSPENGLLQSSKKDDEKSLPRKPHYNAEGSTAGKMLEVYHQNGQLHYKISRNGDGIPLYLEVFSKEGTSILDPAGNGTETFYDPFSRRTLYREFHKFHLTASWYLDAQNKKIYQLAHKNASMRSFKSYSTLFSDASQYPQEDLLAGTEGVLLVKFLITPKNQVENFAILQSLSPTIDQEVLRKLEYIRPAIQFKSGKYGREKVYQEVVLPIYFSMLRQSSGNSYYYHHHHLFMQQRMQQPLNITPPDFSNFK